MDSSMVMATAPAQNKQRKEQSNQEYEKDDHHRDDRIER
jgi:hypothetical protein